MDSYFKVYISYITSWGSMETKMDIILSSPSRQNFESYTRGVETQLRVAELEQHDLIQIRLAVKEAQ